MVSEQMQEQVRMMSFEEKMDLVLPRPGCLPKIKRSGFWARAGIKKIPKGFPMTYPWWCTPPKAEEILPHILYNRMVRKQVELEYHRRMSDNEWKINPTGLIFNELYHLINGETTLRAVIASGKSIWVMVSEGYPVESFKYLDSTCTRYPHHVLEIKEENYPRILSATVKGIISHEKRRVPQTGHVRPSAFQIESRLERSPEIRRSVEKCYGKDTRELCSISILATIHFMVINAKKRGGVKARRQKADKFVHQLRTGEELKKGDPILALRNFLIECRLNQNKKLKPSSQTKVIKAAWNYWISGKKIHHIRIPDIDPEIL